MNLLFELPSELLNSHFSLSLSVPYHHPTLSYNPSSIPSFSLPPQLALLFFEVVMLVVHCLSKPYEAKWINVVEALILLDLFVATAAILQRQDRYIPRWLGSVVVILPFVYAVAVGTYLVGKYLW